MKRYNNKNIAYYLLDKCFDTDEWDDNFRISAIENIAKEIADLPHSLSLFDTDFHLYDLLTQIYIDDQI